MEVLLTLLLILFVLFIQLVLSLAPFFVIGRILENRHFSSIKKRERELLQLPAVNLKRLGQEKEIEKTELVMGSAVISLDYFKRFLAMLRNIFGGRVGSYESLLERARREAILRMKESCPDADLVLNLRLETSSIGKSADRKKTIGAIEALAYGTAVYYRSHPGEKI